ncbi:hypothetical protein RchiOBHm_Chr3g0448411 [Rosa chinensis]|uniref:Late embryogenesis abundant protein LEA-2 subgroup domain-containing protein n=1 Tax=Rosa chinensis TaxID=74649 RepID=A0A2P6R574_ROSCH|nr:hypothetical protein RchiOBHm_Chr3g0448411 [Rosa chinensis]
MAKDADCNNANGFLLELEGILSLLTLIVLCVFAALMIILFTRPYIANSDITHASLAEFNFSTPTATNNFSANILHYKLNLNIAVGNPNENYGIYHDKVQMLAYYKKQRFGMANLSSFYQGKRNITEMTLPLKGQQVMIFDGIEDLCKLKHRDDGADYDIVDELYRQNKYQATASAMARLIRPSWEDKSKMTCYLVVPLISGYKNNRGARSAMCYEDHFDVELYFHFVFLCLLEFHLVILAVVLVLILLGASAEAEEQGTAVQVHIDNGRTLIIEL